MTVEEQINILSEEQLSEISDYHISLKNLYDEGKYKETYDFYANYFNMKDHTILTEQIIDNVFVKYLYDIGFEFYEGKNVDKNLHISIELFAKCANLNYKYAQYMLGVCYFKGVGGLEKNYALAVEWLTKAANQGYSLAQKYLASILEEHGNKLAVHWYEKANELGDKDAKKSLRRLKFSPIYYLVPISAIIGILVSILFINFSVIPDFFTNVFSDLTATKTTVNETDVQYKVSQDIIDELYDIWANYDDTTFGSTYWADNENYKNLPALTQEQVDISNRLKEIYIHVLSDSGEAEHMGMTVEELQKKFEAVDVIFVKGIQEQDGSIFTSGVHIKDFEELVLLPSEGFWGNLTDDNSPMLSLFFKYEFLRDEEWLKDFFEDNVIDTVFHELSHVLIKNEGVTTLLTSLTTGDFEYTDKSFEYFEYTGRSAIYRGLHSANPKEFWNIALNDLEENDKGEAFKQWFENDNTTDFTYEDLISLMRVSAVLHDSSYVSSTFVDIIEHDSYIDGLDLVNNCFNEYMKAPTENLGELNSLRNYIEIINEIYYRSTGISITPTPMQSKLLLSIQIFFMSTFLAISILLFQSAFKLQIRQVYIKIYYIALCLLSMIIFLLVSLTEDFGLRWFF